MLYTKEELNNYLSILSNRRKSLKWRLRILAAKLKQDRKCKDQKHKNDKRRKPRYFRTRNRGFAIDEMSRLDEPTFVRMFRMDRATFVELCELISPHVIRDDKYCERVVPVETRLAVTLRWLAGGVTLIYALTGELQNRHFTVKEECCGQLLKLWIKF
jgi:hypothetical protein